LLIYFGFKLVIFSIQSGQTTPSLQISTYWVYRSIPVGATLSLLYLLMDTFKLLKTGKSNGELVGKNGLHYWSYYCYYFLQQVYRYLCHSDFQPFWRVYS